MAGDPRWGLDPDFPNYNANVDPGDVVSASPDGADNTGLGPETVVILIGCLCAPLFVIFAVVFGKRCYRRVKRLRKVSHRKDDLEGVDNPGLELEETGAGLVRSVGGSVVIVNGTIRPSPITGRHKKKKRCYDEDSIDYGDDCQAFPDDILAEIDAAHSKVKSNGIEVQLEDKAKAQSDSDGSSYAHDPRIRSQLNGYANGNLPRNGMTCTAVSTVADVLKETLSKPDHDQHNDQHKADLSIRDCQIIIHAICDQNESKVKPKLLDESPLKRMAPERMTMPFSGFMPFPRRKSSTPSIRSLEGSKNAESWLHSAYTLSRAIKMERSG